MKITRRCLVPQQLGTFEQLDVSTREQKERNVALLDWSDSDPIPFMEMWDFQKGLVQFHLDRLSIAKSQSLPSKSQFLPESEQQTRIISFNKISTGLDSVIMLQHEPVYTLGTASDPDFIQDKDKVDIVRMDRGGEVTYHGPGQLVVYPILDLRLYKQDIHWYMRALEETILIALGLAGIKGATREENVTGIWIQEKKVAAIGIKARRWVTMHGLAVNVQESSLSNFDGIVPCGLEGRGVACVNQHLDEPLTVQEFAVHMKKALEQVFQIHLQPTTDTHTFDSGLMDKVVSREAT